MTLHRLILTRVPWPTLRQQPNHEHLRLEWSVTTEDGRKLITKSPNPTEDGALALLTNTIALPDDLMTVRHVDRPYDSFVPTQVRVFAKSAIRRQESRQRIAEYAKRWKPKG